MSSCLLTLPVVALLRQALGGSTIWGVSWEREFADQQPRPEFDHWLVLTGGWADPITAWSLPRMDLVVDTRPGGQGGWFAWLCGAKCRVGAPAVTERPGDLTAETVDTRQILQSLNIDAPRQVQVLDREVELATAAQLRALHLQGGYIVMQADRSVERIEGWSVERFGRIAKRLGQKYQLPTLLLWHGASGQMLAQRAAARSGGNAIVCPPVSLSEQYEILKQSSAIVSMEKRMTAVAASVCVPHTNPREISVGVSGTEPLDTVRFESSLSDQIFETHRRSSRPEDPTLAALPKAA